MDYRENADWDATPTAAYTDDYYLRQMEQRLWPEDLDPTREGRRAMNSRAKLEATLSSTDLEAPNLRANRRAYLTNMNLYNEHAILLFSIDPLDRGGE